MTPLRPDQVAYRALYKELVETNTTLSAGSCTLAAEQLAAHLKSLALEDVLIIVEAPDEKLALAARNLPHVELLSAAMINPVSLARHEKVLATVGAVKLLEERLQ